MLKSFLFLMNLAEGFGSISVAPSNTVVRVGEKLLLECRTNNGSNVRKWTLYNISRSTENIYKHPDLLNPNFRHFAVQVDADGSGILYTNSTRLEDAGMYGCDAIVDGKDETFTAQVVVMESLPVCETNLTGNYSYSLIDGDRIWIQCNINFRGFWAPSMEWIQHGLNFAPEGKTITDGIETIHSPSQSVTLKLTIALISSTSGSYYSCKTYFANCSKTEATTADNVPNFTYTWNSTQFFIAVTSSTTERSFSVRWSLVSLSLFAGMSVFFILMVALVIVRCIRFKKNVSVGDINEHTLTKNHQRNQSIPVHAEVNKIEKEKKIAGPSDQIGLPFPTNSKPKQNYAGADGTLYMELDSLTEFKSNAVPTKRPPMLDLVEIYASIDHTVAVPPPSPPPPVPRRH